MHLTRHRRFTIPMGFPCSSSLRPGDDSARKTKGKQTGRLDVVTSSVSGLMEDSKRSTIYFGCDVHRALRLRAAACNRSISNMVNEAVRLTLAEESSSFEGFVASLKDSGRL